MTCTEANPVIRPVFVIVEEVPRPHHRTAAVTRRPDYTVVHVHPGSDVPTVAADISRLLTEDSDFETWAGTYLGKNTRTLARFRASPAGTLPDRILRTPVLARYIPAQLQAPWADYA